MDLSLSLSSPLCLSPSSSQLNTQLLLELIKKAQQLAFLMCSTVCQCDSIKIHVKRMGALSSSFCSNTQIRANSYFNVSMRTMNNESCCSFMKKKKCRIFVLQMLIIAVFSVVQTSKIVRGQKLAFEQTNRKEQARASLGNGN